MYTRFVEIGRVCYIQSGVNRGKLCVILDVVDQRRVRPVWAHRSPTKDMYVSVLLSSQALIDGPNMKRQALSFSHLSLTDFKVSVSRSARQKQVKAKFEAADIQSKWEKTAWAQKIAKKAKRQNLTDFDRFKLRVLRQQVLVLLFSGFRVLSKG